MKLFSSSFFFFFIPLVIYMNKDLLHTHLFQQLSFSHSLQIPVEHMLITHYNSPYCSMTCPISKCNMAHIAVHHAPYPTITHIPSYPYRSSPCPISHYNTHTFISQYSTHSYPSITPTQHTTIFQYHTPSYPWMTSFHISI